MDRIQINPIGQIKICGDEMFIMLHSKYAEGLIGLEDYSHVNVLWWFSECDNKDERNILSLLKPYKKGPDIMGTFALRQPQRPNPIALSIAKIVKVDRKKALVQVTYIDAKDGSPVLDLKPYIPSLDFVENNVTPKWCQYWPNSFEKSLKYNWKNEFTFY